MRHRRLLAVQDLGGGTDALLVGFKQDWHLGYFRLHTLVRVLILLQCLLCIFDGPLLRAHLRDRWPLEDGLLEVCQLIFHI